MKLRGLGFVKEVGFKPGVKDRWSYMDVQSGEPEEEEVGLLQPSARSSTAMHNVLKLNH